MNTKQAILGVVALLVLGALVFVGLRQPSPTEEPVDTHEQEEQAPVTFNSSMLGLMFVYPGNYTLQTHEQGTAERMWTVLTLIDSEILQQAVENGASEGPPAIAVQVFSNVEGLSAEEWIKSSSYSNYQLASDPTLKTVTVGGEQGLAYRYSGLFETDAVVVARGSKMYMFSVDWLTAEDVNRHDFEHILETISFH